MAREVWWEVEEEGHGRAIKPYVLAALDEAAEEMVRTALLEALGSDAGAVEVRMLESGLNCPEKDSPLGECGYYFDFALLHRDKGVLARFACSAAKKCREDGDYYDCTVGAAECLLLDEDVDPGLAEKLGLIVVER